MTDKRITGEGDRTVGLSFSESDAEALLDGILQETLGRQEKDLQLLSECRYFAEARRKLQVFYTESTLYADHELRLKSEKLLLTKLQQHTSMIADVAATTLKGHRARAAVVLTLDEGAMIEQAREGQLFSRVLLALLVDLLKTANTAHVRAHPRTRKPKSP
jgi:hypothetical protein